MGDRARGFLEDSPPGLLGCSTRCSRSSTSVSEILALQRPESSIALSVSLRRHPHACAGGQPLAVGAAGAPGDIRWVAGGGRREFPLARALPRKGVVLQAGPRLSPHLVRVTCPCQDAISDVPCIPHTESLVARPLFPSSTPDQNPTPSCSGVWRGPVCGGAPAPLRRPGGASHHLRAPGHGPHVLGCAPDHRDGGVAKGGPEGDASPHWQCGAVGAD